MTKAKKLLGKLLFQIFLKMFSFYFCFIRLNPETHYNISGIYNVNKKKNHLHHPKSSGIFAMGLNHYATAFSLSESLLNIFTINTTV